VGAGEERQECSDGEGELHVGGESFCVDGLLLGTEEVMRVMYITSPQHHSYTTSGPADRTPPQMRSQIRSDDPSCAILPSLGAMYS
jgi:hypothetical protein